MLKSKFKLRFEKCDSSQNFYSQFTNWKQKFEGEFGFTWLWSRKIIATSWMLLLDMGWKNRA